MEWHGLAPHAPDWSDASRFLAFSLRTGPAGQGGVYAAFNTSHLPQVAQLPAWPGRVWQAVVDTGKVRGRAHRAGGAGGVVGGALG